MLNPIHRQKTNKSLTSKDVPRLKSDFIRVYGYDCWQNIGLDEFFELLPELEKYVVNQEFLRVVLLKHCRVKNPK
jgi:hypothetical protein